MDAAPAARSGSSRHLKKAFHRLHAWVHGSLVTVGDAALHIEQRAARGTPLLSTPDKSPLEPSWRHPETPAEKQGILHAVTADSWLKPTTTYLSSPTSRTGWWSLNASLVRLPFAWIFCLLRGSVLLAARSNTCGQCYIVSKLLLGGKAGIMNLPTVLTGHIHFRPANQ